MCSFKAAATSGKDLSCSIANRGLLNRLIVFARSIDNKYLLTFLLIIIPLQLSAQLEGWQKVRDPDGNTFYLDRDLRIHTSAEPEETFKPVSIPNSGYDVEQNGALVKRPYPAEGMIYSNDEKSLITTQKKGDAPRNADDFANNRYFLDKNQKVHIWAEPEGRYKPVAIEGIEYYVEQGDALIKQHYPVDGLRMLKGVKLLSDTDPRAHGAGVRASKIINDYIKKEKERYPQTSHQAALVLVRQNTLVTADNDWMNYSLSSENRVAVLKREILEKEGYARDGTMIGLSFNAGTTGFDALLSVNAEEFHYVIESHAKLEEIWENKTGKDPFIRKTLEENDTRVLYSFNDSASHYSGYEIYCVNGKKGYHARILVPEAKFGALDEKIRKVIGSFVARGRD
jgi:hypothetical protein